MWFYIEREIGVEEDYGGGGVFVAHVGKSSRPVGDNLTLGGFPPSKNGE